MVGVKDPNMLRRMHEQAGVFDEEEEEEEEEKNLDSCDHSECDPEWKFCPFCGKGLAQ